MSGGVDFRPFPNNWDIKKALGEYANNTTNWDSNVAINLIDNLENKKIALIVDCGIDDFFITVNRNLHKKFMDLKIDHDYIERPGAHNKAYWENSVDYQLLFFKKYFSQGI
jgi:enterochelin esterase-like enzyme